MKSSVRRKNVLRSVIRLIAVGCLGTTAAFAPCRGFAAPISLQALTSFGAGGWLSGTAFGINGTNGSIRSMALNPITGNLLVANGSALQAVNGTTGVVGATLSSSGIAGGTRNLRHCTEINRSKRS